MAVLPPDLTEELVAHLAPLFRREEDRDGRLIVPLSDWSGRDDIIWSGSGRAFTARLVRQLPGDRLRAVLHALQRSDNLDLAQVTAWCEPIHKNLAGDSPIYRGGECEIFYGKSAFCVLQGAS